jgi:hypothetical protein
MTGHALFRSNTQYPKLPGRGVLRVKQPGFWRSESSNQNLYAMQPLSITRCTLASAGGAWRQGVSSG